MASQRPPSGRPMSHGSGVPGSARPPTSRPPQTAIRTGTGMVPGTGARPGTRGGPVSTPGVLSAQIKVTDRPVTQQGLSGMKTGMKGPQRQIMDKSYYLGLLRMKIHDLTTESSKLQKEIDTFNQENSVYLSYEKRAEGLAGEISDLQGQLADYNRLVDQLNTNTELEEVVNDFNMLKDKNDAEALKIDAIFTQRQQTEDQVRVVEDAIEREKQVEEDRVKNMSPAEQEKYAQLKATNEEVEQKLEVQKEEWESLESQKKTLEAKLAHSQVKQEAVRLYEKLEELQSRRDAMVTEDNNLLTPSEEKDKLLLQIKESQKEWSNLNRQLSKMQERLKQVQEEMQQLDDDMENGRDNSQNYKELQKKEETLNLFLDTFEENKGQEEERIRQTQANITSLLEHSSRNLTRLQQISTVTASELRDMQEDLSFKETEMHRSHSTAQGLSSEHERLQMALQKVQQLESKVTSEEVALREKIAEMNLGLETFSNLDALRAAADSREKKLQEDQVTLTQRRDAFKKVMQKMNQEYEVLKNELAENERHTQLTNLEKKWQHLEQNNFVLKEYMASKGMESDYHPVAQNVSRQLAEYNKILVDALQGTRP